MWFRIQPSASFEIAVVCFLCSPATSWRGAQATRVGKESMRVKHVHKSWAFLDIFTWELMIIHSSFIIKTSSEINLLHLSWCVLVSFFHYVCLFCAFVFHPLLTNWIEYLKYQRDIFTSIETECLWTICTAVGRENVFHCCCSSYAFQALVFFVFMCFLCVNKFSFSTISFLQVNNNFIVWTN